MRFLIPWNDGAYRGISVDRETVGGVHNTRAGLFHDMDDVSNICTDFA